MTTHYATESWSIELADGWHVAEDSNSVEIQRQGGTARVRLSSFDPNDTKTTAHMWVELLAQVSRKRGRSVTPVHLGDFMGYLIEYQSEGTRHCEWALRAGEFPLDATYDSDGSPQNEIDGIVERMLGTLRFRGVAA